MRAVYCDPPVMLLPNPGDVVDTSPSEIVLGAYRNGFAKPSRGPPCDREYSFTSAVIPAINGAEPEVPPIGTQPVNPPHADELTVQ